MIEPPENVYPPNTEKLRFRKAENIWQWSHVRNPRTYFFIEAKTPSEARSIIHKICEALGLEVKELNIQFRRLPICELKEKKKNE